MIHFFSICMWSFMLMYTAEIHWLFFKAPLYDSNRLLSVCLSTNIFSHFFFSAAVNLPYICKKHSWGHKQRNGISSHRICALSTLLDNSGLLIHVPLGNLLNYALNFTGQFSCGFVILFLFRFFCVGFYCFLGGFWWIKCFMNSPICLSFYWHIVIHK